MPRAVTSGISAWNNWDVLYPPPISEKKLIMPLNELEKAVLEQMLRQASDNLVPLLKAQIEEVSVVSRKNSGAGFFTELRSNKSQNQLRRRSSKTCMQILRVSSNRCYFYYSCAMA